jgi:choline dehydrogenase-like flavoprotein
VGGQVELRDDGSPLLDYPISDYVLEGARRSMLSMAQIQFEAGATTVYPGHELAEGTSTWAETKAAIEALPMKPLLTKIGSAHVMGGCGIAADASKGVTRPDGVHWQLENLSIHDGSIFPTSIGANPQLSIYGNVNRLAQGLAKRLTNQEVALA